jgi:beta-1,4-mannosyltransferase
LQPEDYARLLGSADLGICLHRSSSGVDLPMKVADMFGAGLPVCAYDYGPCLREMIRPNENGVLFADGAGLADQLHQLLAGFPQASARLDALRQGAQARRAVTWGEGWRAEALPLVRRLLDVGSPTVVEANGS